MANVLPAQVIAAKKDEAAFQDDGKAALRKFRNEKSKRIDKQ